MNAHVPARNRQTRALVVAFGVGSLVAVGLGVYGSTHEPAFFALARLCREGFSAR